MKKILYVEDNEDNVFMLQMRLEISGGYEVVVAPDGAEGVALAVSARPDLILMDLNLPVLDGWEATRRIKADARSAAIPVIALTAHAMAGDREKAIRPAATTSTPSRLISTGSSKRSSDCLPRPAPGLIRGAADEEGLDGAPILGLD